IWARPDQVIQGQLRELSPVADSATRTYAAKITMLNAPEEVKLGMTAYVAFAAKTPETAIKVPLTALFQDKAATAVWVVENGAVRLAPVKVAGTTGNDILLGGGVSAGQTIVTAGVNLLKPGQKVKILGEEAVEKAAARDVATLVPTDGVTK
ncbi:MAG: rane fusion protein multidrug efflux system, partial [Burkholderiales bacterium]